MFCSVFVPPKPVAPSFCGSQQPRSSRSSQQPRSSQSSTEFYTAQKKCFKFPIFTSSTSHTTPHIILPAAINPSVTQTAPLRSLWVHMVCAGRRLNRGVIPEQCVIPGGRSTVWLLGRRWPSARPC